MNSDTKWLIKHIIIAIVLGLLAAVLMWLTESAIAAQPPARTLDARLVRATGQIFDYPSGDCETQVGSWNQQSLAMPRVRAGRVRLIEVITGWGDHLWVATVVGAPQRSDGEGESVAVIERQGSLWRPLSGEGRLWHLGGGDYRLAVVLVLVGDE